MFRSFLANQPNLGGMIIGSQTLNALII